MSATSTIQWTDATWNPVRGCTRVSEGCRNCYAEAVAARFSDPGMPYDGLARRTESGPRWTGKIMEVERHLRDPLSWRTPKRIFVNSMSDLFHDGVSDEWIMKVLAVIALSAAYGRGHTFQLLTKRPERMRDFFSCGTPEEWASDIADAAIQLNGSDQEGCHAANAISGVLGEGRNCGWPMSNLWLGVSVEHQAAADERIPLLIDTPAAVRFLSCEPLLGPVSFRWAAWQPIGRERHTWHLDGLRKIDWVIVGGESGPKARALDVRWVSEIVAQCKEARVATFVKQLGAVPMEPEADWRGRATTRVLSAKNKNRVPADFVPLAQGDTHGSDPAWWPEELRVRDFPASEVRS